MSASGWACPGRTIRSFAALLNLDPAIEELLGDRLTELRTRGLTRVGYDRELQMDLARRRSRSTT